MSTSVTTSTEGLYQGLEWLSHVIHTKKRATQGTGSTKNRDEEVDEADEFIDISYTCRRVSIGLPLLLELKQKKGFTQKKIGHKTDIILL